MAAGKLQIISSILKLDKQFRATHITDMTGLDRNLVRYHLMQFVEQGHLEKFDKYYVIKSKEGLLDSMIDATEKLETALPKPAGTITEEAAAYFNMVAELNVAARTLELPMSGEHREYMIKKCDDTVTYMKQLRKYLTNATKTEGSARRWFRKNVESDQIDKVWNLLVKGSADPTDFDTFALVYEKAMVEDE